jgi:hypothetical protein
MQRWDDIWQSAHDRAFMVAGAQKADLLNDLREAVGGYFERGDTIQDFRKNFERIVADRGWTGWTGEGSQAGRAWRTRVIYTTNVASSYAAGRYQQLTDPELLAERPYWRYVHNDSVLHPRPHHQAWGKAGLTLRHDHAFWKTHFPPNGWGCRCRVTAVRGPRAGDATEPPGGWNTTVPKTGAPPGIDKGWAYAPGRTWHPDLDKYPYEVARDLVAENMRDGVFDRWHAHLAAQVRREMTDPALMPLGKQDLIDEARRRVTVDEHYPVAVLNPTLVEKMGVQTRIVRLSAYDLVKQQVSRSGQDFGALDYLTTQATLDGTRLMVRESGQMTLFLADAAGQWYAAVLQQTATGKGVFLKSYRRSSLKDARRQRAKGEVLIDTLPE